MTLKCNINQSVLSLYPFEYASKALDYGPTFEELHQKVQSQLQNLPDVDNLLASDNDV